MNKSVKSIKQHNTPKTKTGSGDYYGTGVRQKVGKQLDSYVDIPYGKKTKTPPKSMA
jgi:hypothetical protein